MNIPNNNSLKEQIKEIVSICEELAKDYGDDASWFNPPATEGEISKWEEKNGVIIPESYKDWLRFANGAQIRMSLAEFYEINKIELEYSGIPKDYIVIGSLIGDGELLCFSKSTGKFIRYFEKQIDEAESFTEIIYEIIRMARGKSSLSEGMKNLLMEMVSKSKKEN